MRSRDEFGAVYRAVGEQVASSESRRSFSQHELAALTAPRSRRSRDSKAGSRAPRLDTLLRVANALDCALDLDLRPRTTIERGVGR